ncbi:MAG: hypothetical protein P8O81_04015, partial [Flavobacteriaceae bacterium]|nr:hypothetical protein [Flavobacteriaceae bacterium]
MKKLLLLLLFIPLVSFLYFFVSGFKVSSDKTQISSDPDLKLIRKRAKSREIENQSIIKALDELENDIFLVSELF